MFEEKTGPKEARKVNIEAHYQFELLHHDMRGNILARYKVRKLRSLFKSLFN